MAWRAVPKRAPREAAIGTPAVASGFVPRPELTNRIVRALLAGRASKVGITTALSGAGGFGKTTLATAVCELPEIKKAFPSTYWVTVGQEVRGAALADTINDVIERIGKQRSGITSPEQAGLELGERLKEQGPSLLVVDDVWTAEQLRPFLNAGRGCTLLVTTRIPTLLTDHADAETVQVDQMSHAQARQLVTGGVPGLPEAVGEQLMEITGRWPIALRLANATLRRTARDGGDVTIAAERLLNRLRDLGPTALDLANEARRERTVAATLESSLGVLGEQRNRVLELAIFPEDTEVPQDLVALLWQATANLSTDDGDRLCHELAELSLVTRHGDRLRVHDVIRAYLRHECGQQQLQRLNNTLLDAVASTLPSSDPVAWWTLPRTAEYLWRSLAYHLNDADRATELATLVTAPHWVEQFDGVLVSGATDWQMSRPLRHPTELVLNRMSAGGHLVCAVDEQDRVVVWDVETWQPPVFLEADESGPHVRQEPPNPFMERIRDGIKRIRKTTTDIDIEVAPGGEWLAVKVGDVVHVTAPKTWKKIATWRLPTDAGKPKAGPGGRWLAVHVDGTIRMLNSDTWTVDAELPAPPDARFVRDAAWSPDGSLLATVSDDRTLRVHDGRDWTTRTEIRLDGELKGCAWISNDRLVAVGGHGVYWFTYVPG